MRLLVFSGLLVTSSAFAASSTYPYKVVKVAPPGITIEGTIVAGLSFTDDAGDNLFFVTHTDEKRGPSLHFTQYVKEGSGYRVLAKIDDAVLDCKKDVRLEMVAGALVVTDLDANKKAEVTFAYERSCASTLGPDALVLYVVTDGQKLALRGSTVLMAKRRDGAPQKLVESGPIVAPKADPTLVPAKALYKFALACWDEWKVDLLVRQ